MEDGILGIDFIFNQLESIFDVILGNWLSSAFFFVNIFGLIALIYINVKNK